MSTWVLVAHRTGARLFEQRGSELRQLESIEFPAGRVEDQALERTAQRSFDSHAQGRHAADRGASPHERVALSFARALAKILDRGRVSGVATEIVLVAEPRFLGLLRAELSRQTEALVSATVAKDLYRASEAEVLKHVQGLVAPVLSL